MADSTDTAFDHAQFDTIYPAGVERHYWNRCRNAVIASHLRAIGAEGPFLEIGCGKGLVVHALRKEGFDMTGVELAAVDPVPEAAPYVDTGTDARSLDVTARATVRTILLLDVIEHLADPMAFLSELRPHFPALRHMVFTVPACQELFSNYDRFNNHFRRYGPAQLKAHTTLAGDRYLGGRYFFHLLYPAARLQLKCAGARTVGFTVPTPGPSAWFHALLGHWFFLEYKLLPGSWKGTSLIAAVEVKNRQDQER